MGKREAKLKGMIMPNQEQQRLRNIFAQLAPEQQQTLLAFAEFLHQHSTPRPPAIPQIIPRPTDESVVAAIKRLAHSYPMLDKAVMLNETSRLMTEHILHGRDKVKIIDELEVVFLRYYEKFTSEKAI